MKTAIRPVAQDDRARWDAFFDAYAAFYKTSVSEDAKELVWGWIFDAKEDFWCDLALDETGQPVGMVQYQLMHRSLSGEKVIYLSDLYVDPDLRGSGAGRAMIDHVIAFARGRGISSVRWLTQEFNYAGRRLYDSYQPKSDFILYNVPVARD